MVAALTCMSLAASSPALAHTSARRGQGSGGALQRLKQLGILLCWRHCQCTGQLSKTLLQAHAPAGRCSPGSRLSCTTSGHASIATRYAGTRQKLVQAADSLLPIRATINTKNVLESTVLVSEQLRLSLIEQTGRRLDCITTHVGHQNCPSLERLCLRRTCVGSELEPAELKEGLLICSCWSQKVGSNQCKPCDPCDASCEPDASSSLLDLGSSSHAPPGSKLTTRLAWRLRLAMSTLMPFWLLEDLLFAEGCWIPAELRVTTGGWPSCHPTRSPSLF